MKVLEGPFLSLPPEFNSISGKIVDAAFAVHSALGPGLMESVCEICLARELESRGLAIEQQSPVEIKYKGISLGSALRLDLLVENKVVVELKAVESILPVHEAQLLTYLKLSGFRLGLLLNFNVRFLKEGIRRKIL